MYVACCVGASFSSKHAAITSNLHIKFFIPATVERIGFISLDFAQYAYDTIRYDTVYYILYRIVSCIYVH